MKIYIVNEIDERPDAVRSGPLSAHVDKARASAAMHAFNEQHCVKQGAVQWVYAIVVPLDLDLAGDDLETGALRMVVADAERRLADH